MSHIASHSSKLSRRNADNRRTVKRRYNYSIHEYDFTKKEYDPAAYGDLDLQGLFPILVASCIMLTPILNWSIEIRLVIAEVFYPIWLFR